MTGVEPMEPLGFAQLLMDVIDEGRRTATYKLAVLLALVDTATLAVDRTGRPPERVSTRDLARRVVHLYWPQVRPYPLTSESDIELRQSTQPRAVTVDAVRDLREAAAAVGAGTASLAEMRLPELFQKTLDTVELNLVRMPLGKLQRPQGFSESGASDYPRFLYDDTPFHEGVRMRDLKASRLHVELQPGVADWLVSLSGLVRPLVELHWTRAVARLNHRELHEDGLREFLFGSSRTALARLVPGLQDMQQGCCFYCNGRLRPGEIEVDHFVPWSRVPNDALTNLVLADRRCNNSKRNHLADLTLLERWWSRSAGPLHEISSRTDWPVQTLESIQMARAVYVHAPDGTHLWSQPGVFTLLERSRLTTVLTEMESP
ncbi:MAG TPA: HNH endonuclease signature motif containing protein [Actinomycetes bacterium]